MLWDQMHTRLGPYGQRPTGALAQVREKIQKQGKELRMGLPLVESVPMPQITLPAAN